VLEGFKDGEIRIELDLDQVGRTVIGLPIALVAEAKLVLTDELVREALRRAKKDKKSGDEVGTGDA
jgi:ribosome maturation factor RimP